MLRGIIMIMMKGYIFLCFTEFTWIFFGLEAACITGHGTKEKKTCHAVDHYFLQQSLCCKGNRIGKKTYSFYFSSKSHSFALTILHKYSYLFFQVTLPKARLLSCVINSTRKVENETVSFDDHSFPAHQLLVDC